VLRRLIILDIALLALLVAGAMKFYQDWLAFGPTHDLAAIQPQPEAFPPLPLTSAGGSQATSDWTEISARNPFSFDRNDIAILAPQNPEVNQGPRPVLFGVMSLGGPRMAMVAPGQPRGNRNYKPMQTGETIDGWTIVQVDTMSMIIESNGTRETVLMNDPTAQIPRDSTRTVSAGSAPMVIQSAAPASSSGVPSTASSAPSPANSGTPGSNPAASQPRTRILQTPFGPVRQVIEEDPQQ
jgi:hypothetical protein